MKKLRVLLAAVLALSLTAGLIACGEKEKTPTTATVTFDQNYEGAPEALTVKVNVGESVYEPKTPERSGYAFGGWFKDAAGTDPYSFAATVPESKTVYAGWNKINKVTYSIGEDVSYGDGRALTYDVVTGDGIYLMSGPESEDYAFLGWKIGDKTIAAGSEYKLAADGDVTITAVFNPIFTVTFKDYDGRVVGTQRVEKGESATAPADFVPAVRQNYVFSGEWSIELDEITGDATAYALYNYAATSDAFFDYVGLKADGSGNYVVAATGEEIVAYAVKGKASAAGTFEKKVVLPVEYAADGLPVVMTAVGAFDSTAVAFNAESVFVPETYVALSEKSFYGAAELLSVEWSENCNVTKIGDYCFGGEAGKENALRSVEIPASVKSIGDYAFSFATALESVTFAADGDIRTIGKYAFSAKTKGKYCPIYEISFPASLESIGDNAFSNIPFEKVAFARDGSLKQIGKYAFDLAENANENSAVKSLVIPSSVETIGDYAFRSWSNLTSVVTDQGSALTEIGNYAFQNNANLRTVLFNDGLQTIGKYAFDSCALRGISIPGSVSSIGEYAFSNSKTAKQLNQFVTVDFEPGTEALEIGNYAFAPKDSGYRSNLRTLNIPARVTKLGNYAFAFNNLAELTFEESAAPLDLGTGVFAQTYSSKFKFSDTGFTEPASYDSVSKIAVNDLKEVSLTRAIKGGFGAFLGNSALETVNLGAMTQIPTAMFAYCPVLDDVGFAAVEKIGPSAFAAPINWTGKTFTSATDSKTKISLDSITAWKVEIPVSMTEVGKNAFAYRKGLNLSFALGGDQPLTLGDSAFSGKTSDVEQNTATKTIVIPSRLAAWGKGTFAGFYALTSVTFENDSISATAIPSQAFIGCEKLETIKIPAGIKILSDGAFNASGLTEMTYAENCVIEEIQEKFIAGTPLLGSSTMPSAYQLPGTIKTIGDRALSGWYYNPSDVEKTLTIPETIVSIGTNAFMGVTTFEKFVIEGTADSEAVKMNNVFFAGTYSVKSIEVKKPAVITGKCFALGTLTELKMPYVTELPNNMMDGFSEVEGSPLQLTVGTLTSIGDKALAGVPVTTLNISADVTKIGNGAFVNTKIIELNLPTNAAGYTFEDGVLYQTKDGIKTLISYAGNVLDKETVFNLPDDVTAIAENAFYNATNIAKLNLNNVTDIGGDAFRDSDLLEVNMPKITIIGNKAFNFAKKLTKVTALLLEEVGINAFAYAGQVGTGLTLDVPALKKVGQWAFNYSGLTTFDGTNVTEYGKEAFSNSKKLASVTLNAELTAIPDKLFFACSVLNSVEIPEKVTSIGVSAFEGCTALKSIVVPDSVQTIGNTAFKNSGLVSATIGKNAKGSAKMYNTAWFTDCLELETVIFEGNADAAVRYFGNYSSMSGKQGTPKLKALVIKGSIDNSAISASDGSILYYTKIADKTQVTVYLNDSEFARISTDAELKAKLFENAVVKNVSEYKPEN